MHLSSRRLLAVTLAATCISSTIAHPGHFSLQLERVPRTRSIARRSVNGDAEVEAIYQGEDWVTSMVVGGQTLRAQIDTGSADLWFVSTLLPQSTIKANLTQNTLYDPSKSKTWKKIDGEIFDIQYDVGELGASGVVGSETVELGGATVTMEIGAATDIFGPDIIDTIYDGTFGLGWGNTIQTTAGDPRPGQTFFQAVTSQLSQPLMTADFRANFPETLMFGYINSSLYTGTLNRLSVDNSSGYWCINDVSYNSGSKSLDGGSTTTVIMDTGGNGMTVPESVAKDYWSQVSSAQYDSTQQLWSFSCSESSLPDITMNFQGGSSATIKAAVLNASASDNGDGTCTGGLQGETGGIADAGYGFFGSYFTVWNQESLYMEFAPYSTEDSTGGSNYANLPTATDEPGVAAATGIPAPASSASGTGTAAPGVTGTGTGTGAASSSTSSSKAAAVPTQVSNLGLNLAILAGLAIL